MNVFRQRPNVLPWPPLVMAAAIVSALALARLSPWPLAFGGSRILGALLIGAALTVDVWAVTTLRRARTTVLPHHAASALISRGPYSLSRNPIYLANMVLLAGLGLVLANGWFLPLALAAGIAFHFLAVRREENHLIALFGYKYETYCRHVRRWL